MNARYEIIELSEDSIEVPRFNLEASSPLPPFRPSSTQPNVSGPPSKLSTRPTASLQILSPKARAANASKMSQHPTPYNDPRHKGKGRARPVDIIELSDSDDEITVVPMAGPSTSQNAPSTNTPLPNINERLQALSTPAALRDAPGNSNVIPASVEAENVPLNAPPALPAATDGRMDLPAQEVVAVAEASNTNPLDRMIASVLEIIPDVDPDHVMQLFLVNNPTGDMAFVRQLLEPVLHNLFENGNYPKKKEEVKRKRQPDNEGPLAGPSGHKKRKTETVVKMDVTAADRPRIYTPYYYDLCMYWLGVKFPYLRKSYVKNILTNSNNLYAPAFVQLMTMEMSGAIPPTQRKKQPTRPRVNGPLLANADFDREFEWCAAWRPGKSGKIEYILEAAQDGAGQPLQAKPPSASAKDPGEDDPESEDCQPGEGMECGTCFSEYVVTTMIQCPDGHLFCKACVFAFCKERLGQRNAKIKCMDSQTDCPLEYAAVQLQLCLPPRLMALYDRVKQAEEINAAGLDNLEECPFCEYKCVIENEHERLFSCVNEDCGVVSCRACKKKDHLPKTCAEMEEDKTLNAQHAVEEAMTNALMRRCPKCQATFVKSDGCNKITCSKCGQLSCYICRQPIKGYDHFNQVPSGPGGASTSTQQKKCTLWDGPVGAGGANAGLAQRHHDEVVRAREEALAKLKQVDPEVDVSLVKVDAPTAPARPVAPTPLQIQQQQYPLPPMVFPPMPAYPGAGAIIYPPPPVPLPAAAYGFNPFPAPPGIPRQVPAAAPRRARCNCARCQGPGYRY